MRGLEKEMEDDFGRQPIIRFFIYVWRGFLAVVCSVTVTRIGYRLVLYLFSCNCTIHTRTCTNGYMALKNWVKPY